jgi:hypothetical protein
MTFAELFYFTGKCLVMDNDTSAAQQVKATIIAGKVPWKYFVWMGSLNFVLPALYTAFRRNGMLDLLPADLVQHMENIYEINLDRNRRIIVQARKITRMLNAAGIEPIFLKGTGHLLQGLYRDSGDRIMADIDILVREEEIEMAANILFGAGYKFFSQDKELDLKDHPHYPGLFNPEDIAIVEIHRRLTALEYSKYLPLDAIFTERRKIRFSNSYVMSFKHQMILHFIHDQLIHWKYVNRSISLKSLYDFYLIVGHKTPESVVPLFGGLKNKFNSYCKLASATFNQPTSIGYIDNLYANAYLQSFIFFNKHNKWSHRCKLVLVKINRYIYLISFLLQAIYSGAKRRYIILKIKNLI